MKIDREQIEKMAQAMCGFCAVDKRCVLKCCAPCSEVVSQDCSYKENAEMLISAGYGKISEYKEEIEQLNKKLAKQTRIARDANAKLTGVEHYLRPFQYKADRLKTKCNDLKRLSDWQREEIKILKAEVNKGCDNCETIKQAQIDVLKELKGRVRTSYVLDDFILGNVVFSKDIDEIIDEVQNGEDKS